jgi:hypothetical protein
MGGAINGGSLQSGKTGNSKLLHYIPTKSHLKKEGSANYKQRKCAVQASILTYIDSLTAKSHKR